MGIALAAYPAGRQHRSGTNFGKVGDQLPVIELAKGDLDAGIPAFEILCRAGLANSNGEARRLIKGGGGRVNDKAFENEKQIVGNSDMTDDGVIKLSAGKKRHVLVRAV